MPAPSREEGKILCKVLFSFWICTIIPVGRFFSPLFSLVLYQSIILLMQQFFKQIILASLALIVIGWSGLALIIFYFEIPPFVWARWGFFVLGIMALTGTALPVVYFLHRRFPSNPPAEPNVITRQALWVGVYGATLAWLQLGRLVTLYVIFGLAGSLIAIEYFIRLRESANRPLSTDTDDNSS